MQSYAYTFNNYVYRCVLLLHLKMSRNISRTKQQIETKIRNIESSKSIE